MAFFKNIIVREVTEREVITKWGPKKFYLLWAEGEETPYGTWNEVFAKALNAKKGQLVRIAYEIQGQYQNLVVPERFKGQEGKWNLIWDKLSELENRLKGIEERLERIIQSLKAE